MALNLKFGSDATRLLEDLIEVLGRPSGTVGHLVSVLMPSIPLIERAKAELARRHGVAMGVVFLLPAAFIDRMAELVGLAPLHPSWRSEGLTWRLVSLLTSMIEDGRVPRLDSACKDARARFAFAGQLADRFDQYLYFRPAMLAAWERGEAWEPLPRWARSDEAWQRELWSRLSEALSDHPHPVRRLRELERRLLRGAGTLPPSLEVLTTGPLPPTLLPLLRALATRTQVTLRALFPSTEYIGDIRAGRAQLRAGAAVDPAWEGHPLLSHLGQQSVTSFRIFEEALVTEGQEYEDLPPVAERSATLLERLQADIRAARQPDDVDRAPLGPSDRSLRVHRCHGVRREVEVLRDELLDAFTDLPDLKAHEILILAPDLAMYGPLAEVLLREGTPPLPLRLSERRLDQADPLLRGLYALLHLAAGRAPLSEGLALLELPPVSLRLRALGVVPQALADALQASGITWGLDIDHRRALHAGTEETGTWRAGLDRLLAGVWLGACDQASDATSRPALPVFGDLGGDTSSASAGLDWLDGLVSLLVEWQTEASPAGWAERLDQALDTLLASGDGGGDTFVVVELIEELRLAETDHACMFPMDAATVGDWLDRATENETRTVTRVGGGMAMGGFKPLRAIPCRVLAVLGLHDSAFPRRNRAPAWDLLAAAPQPGDWDPVREDRQLFLDALLAATDRVIFTATARNIRSNQEEPLSVCVDEVLRVAARTLASDPRDREKLHRDLIQDHPLHPFDSRCFRGPRASFDTGNLAIARALHGSDDELTPFQASSGEVPPAVLSGDLELEDIIRTLKDPWSAWLTSLGVEFPRPAESPLALDREPVDAPSGLTRWHVQSQVIDAVVKGRTTYLHERLAADRRLPYGSLGASLGGQAVREATRLAELATDETGGPLEPCRLVYHGEQRVRGNVFVNPTRDVQVVIEPSNVTGSPHQRLQAWILANFAAACALPVATLLVSRIDDGARVDRFDPLASESGRDVFNHLLHLCQRARMQPLPFGPKTSAAIHKAKNGKVDAARKAWEPTFTGSPGEGEKPSAQLAWRDCDPFADEVFGEWHRLAIEVFEPLDTWWKTATTSKHRVQLG